MERDPFAQLFVSHQVGDYLFQTDFQALNKADGLSQDRGARRALLTHGLTYTAAFLPTLVGVARRSSIARAAALAALIGIPHVIVDDGRLLRAYMRQVKKIDDPAPALTANVDQSVHMLSLALAARFWR